MEKNNRKKLITIIAIAAIVVVIIGAIIGVYAFANKTTDASLIDRDSMEYMIMNVPKDFTIEISMNEDAVYENGDFTVRDIMGNEAKTFFAGSGRDVQIKAPHGGYVPGKIYSLDLEGKAVFLDEEYADAKKIKFVVEKKSTKEIVYTEKVHQVKKNKVEVSGNRITVEGDYEEGHIILVDTDDNGVDEVYKLENVTTADGKTEATIGKPEADELYEKIDIFFYDEVDLSNAQIDKEAFMGVLNETGILETFLGTAYADEEDDDPPASIEVDRLDEDGKGFEITVTVSDPENEERQLEVSFAAKAKTIFIMNDVENMLYSDVEITITEGLHFGIVSEVEKEADRERLEKKINELYNDYINPLEHISLGKPLEVTLLPITVPIAGPVCLSLELGLTAEMAATRGIYLGGESEYTLKQGFFYDIERKKIIKPYFDIDGDLHIDLMVKGELAVFAGLELETGIEVPAILEIELEVKGGPYFEAEGCFVIKDLPKEVSLKGTYDISSGYLLRIELETEVLKIIEAEIELFEKKFVLFEKTSEGSNPKAQLEKNIDLIGKSKADLLDKYIVLDYGFDYAGGYFYTSSKLGMYVGFSAVDMYGQGVSSPTDFGKIDVGNSVKCNSLMGTISSVLGYKKATDIELIEEALGVNFGEISDPMESYDDPEMGEGYAMYEDKDGNEYQLVITTNINGNVDPDDSLLIIKK